MNFENVKQSIKQHEGLRLKPYKCPANKLTIGYGRNIEDNGISQSEADILLENDINNTYIELSSQLELNYYFEFEKLPKNVQDVLLEMAFQLGVPRFMKFKKTIGLIKQSAYFEASIEMLNSLWAKQTPKRAKKLSNLMKGGK